MISCPPGLFSAKPPNGFALPADGKTAGIGNIGVPADEDLAGA